MASDLPPRRLLGKYRYNMTTFYDSLDALKKSHEAQVQIKTHLWERLNFAIMVLRGTWPNMRVDQLADHLEEVLTECREFEKKQNG